MATQTPAYMKTIATIVFIVIIAIGAYLIAKNNNNKTPDEILGTPTETETSTTTQQETREPAGEVTTTEEGLVYQDVTFGEGEEATEGDTVTVHYVGQLEDGTVFDASTQRGEPFTFTLGAGNVIRGWDIGVAGMKEGGVRVLQIPPQLAYGERGQGPIPPNATLIFQVQLLEVQ